MAVESAILEPDEPGDPFKVSDVQRDYQPYQPEAVKPKSLPLFAKVGCPFCASAKAMLKEHGIDYEEIVLGKMSPIALYGLLQGKKRFKSVNGNTGDSWRR